MGRSFCPVKLYGAWINHEDEDCRAFLKNHGYEFSDEDWEEDAQYGNYNFKHLEYCRFVTDVNDKFGMYIGVEYPKGKKEWAKKKFEKAFPKIKEHDVHELVEER